MGRSNCSFPADGPFRRASQNDCTDRDTEKSKAIEPTIWVYLCFKGVDISDISEPRYPVVYGDGDEEDLAEYMVESNKRALARYDRAMADYNKEVENRKAWSAYITSQTDQFQLREQEKANSAVDSHRWATITDAFKFALVGWIVISVAQAAIGWIVLGFMGKARDFAKTGK